MAIGAAALLVLPMVAGARLRRVLVAAAAVLAVGVGVGLVWHGYHWPLDVLAQQTVAAAVARGVPVLVVAAQDDGVIPPARLREFAEHVGAEVATVATAGHMLPAERPGALAAVLGDWLERTVTD